MKNYIKLTILIGFLASMSFAQVGVNTEIPVTTLDINGDLNVSGKIRVNGTDTSVGNPGAKNKALTSNGEDGPVTWEEVKIPVGYEGGLYLTMVEAASDRVGLNLAATGFGTYAENEALSGNWKEIPGLTKQIQLTRATNKIHVQFQTTAQMNFGGTASFACGLFLDNQLKGVRVDVLTGEVGSYNVFNFNTSFTNVSSGTHTLKVACRGRTYSSPTGLVAIGVPNVTASLNADMAQSALNVLVLEDLLN
ncbi:hypothetical protein [Moheibacter stercoris]|uniref:Uncharacterized protein n=1 Tax=Moheibacter stercoris TaxID=1628251 RepID=A0ABV2LWA8_9FLAO